MRGKIFLSVFAFFFATKKLLSKEPSRCDCSFEYKQHIFKLQDTKNSHFLPHFFLHLELLVPLIPTFVPQTVSIAEAYLSRNNVAF